MGIWGWSAASCILLGKKGHSEMCERNSNPLGASPQKQIPHAVGFSTLPRARKALHTCVDTCTEQLPCWLVSQETQNLPSLQAPREHQSFFSSLYIQGPYMGLTVLEEYSEAYWAGSKFYKHGEIVWIPLCERPCYEV